MKNRREFFETIGGIVFPACLLGRKLPTRNITHLSPADMHERGSCIANGLPNLNGRTYPRAIWEQIATNHRYIQLGINEHPTLQLDLVAGKIKPLHIEDVAGPEKFRVYTDLENLEIFSTPEGKAAEHLIRSGIRLYAVPSGLGRIDDDSIVNDYRFRYWALVGDSSFLCAQPMLLKVTEVS